MVQGEQGSAKDTVARILLAVQKCFDNVYMSP